MVKKNPGSMHPGMLPLTAKCSLGVCPLSQVEVGSAAEGHHLVLLGCAEIILTMSLESVQPEMLLVAALCSLGVYPLSQVEAGSAAEGGRRFLLDCTDFDADRDNQGNLQEWVPLVYPDANRAVPYVMIRLPLQPERPPAPNNAWKKGDRVEVCAVSSSFGMCCCV